MNQGRHKFNFRGDPVATGSAVVNEFEWGTLTWHYSRDLGNSETMTVGECLLNPGCSNPRHYHPNCAEVLRVEKGKIRHAYGDQSFELNEGDMIHIPQYIRHNATNIGSTEAVMFICFSSADRETIAVD